MILADLNEMLHRETWQMDVGSAARVRVMFSLGFRVRCAGSGFRFVIGRTFGVEA